VTRLQAAWLHASSGPPRLLSATEANYSTSSFGAIAQLDPLCAFDSSVQDAVRSVCDAALETDNQEAPTLIPCAGAPVSAASISDVIGTDCAAFDVDEDVSKLNVDEDVSKLNVDEDVSKPAAVHDVDEESEAVEEGAAPCQSEGGNATMTVDANANACIEPCAMTDVACTSMTAANSMQPEHDQTCAEIVNSDVDSHRAHGCDAGLPVNGGLPVEHQPAAHIETMSVNYVDAVQTPANQSSLGHSHATEQSHSNALSLQKRLVSRHELVPPTLPCFLDSKRREVVCISIARVALCHHQLQVLVQQRLYRGLQASEADNRCSS
jgi:hypothetical protein